MTLSQFYVIIGVNNTRQYFLFIDQSTLHFVFLMHSLDMADYEDFLALYWFWSDEITKVRFVHTKLSIKAK